jgi:hypothetical protein
VGQVVKGEQLALRVLRQVVLRNGLPFEVWAPNAETKRAIEELESGGGERFEGGTNELLGHLRGRRRQMSFLRMLCSEKETEQSGGCEGAR